MGKIFECWSQVVSKNKKGIPFKIASDPDEEED
jgi:hypothetical protein